VQTKKRILTLALVGGAVAAGLIAGSLNQFDRLPGNSVESSGGTTGIVDQLTAPDRSTSAGPATTGQGGQGASVGQNDYSVEEPEDSMIFGGDDVVLRPVRRDGLFIGYLVVSSGSHGELTEGRTIVSVNGAPVEDSAAGGELLLAALAGSGASIQYVEEQDVE